jgi:hypothetical protein
MEIRKYGLTSAWISKDLRPGYDDAVYGCTLRGCFKLFSIVFHWQHTNGKELKASWT